jgi:hypothetical protein
MVCATETGASGSSAFRSRNLDWCATWTESRCFRRRVGRMNPWIARRY